MHPRRGKRGWKKPGCFYGWVIVGLCAVVHAMTAPGQTAGVSVFIDPIMESLELSRNEISTAYLVGTLTSALTMSRVGSVIDRLGSRLAIALSGGMFGVVLISLAGMSTLLTVALGFIGIRLLGQGALTLSAQNAVAPWFERRRGFAMGVSTALGMSLISLVPILSAFLISRFGWRGTWVLLGVAVWIVVLPIALRGIVNQPADLDQRPDGGKTAKDTDALEEEVAAGSWTRREAIRTPIYWAVTLSTTTSSMIGTGLNFHQINVLSEQGLTRIEAAANFLPQTVGTLVATLIMGALVDRFSQKWLIVGTMALLSSAMLFVPIVRPGVFAMIYGVLLGSQAGSNRIVESGSTAKLFGLAHLGAIRGITRTVSLGGSAIGPLLISTGYALLGSYILVLRWLLLMPIGIAILALLAPSPDPWARGPTRPT